MAIKTGGTVRITDDRQLANITGYDSDVVTRVVEAIRSENKTFGVYNSAGTAIKTVSFAGPKA